MAKVPAESLKIGDVIMPPPRELQLWMRRRLQEKNLPDSALHLTIFDIQEGNPDKRGRWLIVKTNQAAEWNADSTRPNPLPFTFKVRPETSWILIDSQEPSYPISKLPSSASVSA